MTAPFPEMQKMKLIAIKPHGYGGRSLKTGDSYEAPRIHAMALVAARVSRYDDEDGAKILSEIPEGPKKRRYKRRDMVPEE